MTDCPISTLTVTIPTERYEELLALTKRQNANLNNNVAALLRLGMDATYERWPHLEASRHD